MSPRPSTKILFLTTVHPSWGYGHSRRVISLLKEFPEAEIVDVVLEPEYEPCPDLLRGDDIAFASPIDWPMPVTRIQSWQEFQAWWQGKEFSLVIIDRREPPPIVVEALGDLPIVAFDIRSNLSDYRDYGKALEKITYVVNAIPSLEEDWANLNGWEYLLLSEERKPSQQTDENREIKQKRAVLYLTGFSDPVYIEKAIAGVTDFMVSNRSQSQHMSPTLTLIASEPCRDLVEKIFDFHSLAKEIDYHFTAFDPRGMDWEGVEVIFTHFGLLGMEAMGRGIPTYFLEPTTYHGQLVSRHFPEMALSHDRSLKGLAEADIKKTAYKRLAGLGRGRERLIGILRSLAGLEVAQKKICDLCGNTLAVRHRSSWMNLSLCSGCKSYRLQSFLSGNPTIEETHLWGAPQEDYGREYFLAEYERSYGKSYREDEEAIKKLSQKRMEKINRLWGKKGKARILDIGCAYGYFLDVAAEFGYDTFGVDISRHAGEQMSAHRSVHRFALGDFREQATLRQLSEENRFDIITLWYVIEHFSDIHPVIARISELQTSGGILGLSTPNARGLSSRYGSQEFLRTSPPDHYYIFSIRGLKEVLAKFGYGYVGFRAGGVHPYRFRKAFPGLSWIPEGIYRYWATLTNLGDTMEVYFMKR